VRREFNNKIDKKMELSEAGKILSELYILKE